ncbi:hypothetical protein ACOMHN_053819 [Nucella lapillus]
MNDLFPRALFANWNSLSTYVALAPSLKSLKQIYCPPKPPSKFKSTISETTDGCSTVVLPPGGGCDESCATKAGGACRAADRQLCWPGPIYEDPRGE